jgi:hypothetical protein
MLQSHDLGLNRAARDKCPTLRASIYLNGYKNILIAQQGQITHFVFDWSVIIQSFIIFNSKKLNSYKPEASLKKILSLVGIYNLSF